VGDLAERLGITLLRLSSLDAVVAISTPSIQTDSL
jgi:hypothetical protein